MHFHKHVGLAIVLAGLVTWGVSADELKHTKDSIATVKKNLESGKAVLLDVREKDEWDEGRLKDAQLAPLSKLKEGAKAESLVKGLKPGAIVYTHCKAGVRAIRAAEILKEQGYEVRPLKQGYEDLVKEGLPAAKGR